MKLGNRLLVIIPLFIITFLYGVLVGTYEYFPYQQMNNIKGFILRENFVVFDNQEPYIDKIDINSLIKINNDKDIEIKKNNLISFIWSNNGFPSNKMPSSVENNISDTKYIDLANLKEIDKFTISMEYGVESIAYLFVATNTNNKLIIYHEGHGGDFIHGKSTIQFFLNKGYSVLAFNMPLKGMNNQPIVDLQTIGKLKLTSHDHLQFLESENFSPIKFFVEPITVSLNYLDEQFDFDSYHIIGISGGGWTSIIYSAIDDRISHTYSVAGSYPIFLRYEAKNIGDYEQLLPKFYSISNYLELYVMASYGNDRKLVQIFNKYDPCCFSGELANTYVDEVKAVLLHLQKGEFEVIIDDTHKEHKISQYALELINSFMT